MKVIKQLKGAVTIFHKNKKEKDIFSEIKSSFTVDGRLVYAGRLLQLAYRNFAKKTALISASKSVTYRELYYLAIKLGEVFKELGVKPKDRVVLHCENSIEFYVAYFAIWQIGAVVVPLNIFLHEKELVHIVNDSNPVLAVVGSSLKPVWQKVIDSGLIQNSPNIFDKEDIKTDYSVPEKVEDEYPDFKVEDLSEDDLCVLLYTSGTTGSPKGVMLSSKNVISNTMQVYARLTICGKPKKERLFCVLPLFHVFAQNTCLWLPVMTGAAVIIVQKIDRRLILQGLEKKPTLFFGFPALYGLLCLLKNAPLDSIRMFVSGADMLPDKIRSAFAMIYGRKICSGYGLTESSPVVAVNYYNHAQPTNVVGDPLVGIDCDIRSEDGKSLSVGEVGTLWIKGDNIMLGYYNSPEATEKVLKDGWLNTGDLAYMNKEGFLAITGRSKDLIIHKGFNIYPQEVENVLLSHPSVFRAAVVGKDESVSGQVPIAFVAVKAAEEGIENSLRALCSENLAAYKVPRKFFCLDDLPMNATGKVDKKQLKILD